MNVLSAVGAALYEHMERVLGCAIADKKRFQVTLNTDVQRQQFGDLSANAPLILAKELGRSPRDIAQQVADGFAHLSVARIEIAGPGFLNIFLTHGAYIQLLQELMSQGEQFFKPTTLDDRHVSIEFVSANPTGPLHFGHGRGGIIGDVLGNVMRFYGYRVTKEFYINDAGSQIQKLGESFKARCLQQLGKPAVLPEEGYQGQYLVDLAQQCVKEYGEKIDQLPDDFFALYAKDHLLEQIQHTLVEYGVRFDTWFSEKTLHDSGAIDAAVAYLKHHDYVYEQDGAVWFRASAFGDEKDRVLRKSDGQWTYVASDMAYMRNKIDRGATNLIMVLGQDHHGYVDRIHGLQRAQGLEQYPLDIILYQLVSLREDGQQLRMSKRAGRMVTLQDIIDAVGCDVARFFFLHRKADAHLEFDVSLALKKTEENPVFYIQYAYVRINSILQKAADLKPLAQLTAADAASLTESERILLKKMAALGDVIAAIVQTYQTHQLTYYAFELAQLFHAYYGNNKVIDLEAPAVSRARLLVLTQLGATLKRALSLLGVSAPDRM